MAANPASATQPHPQCPVPFCALCDPNAPCLQLGCGVCSYWADNEEKVA